MAVSKFEHNQLRMLMWDLADDINDSDLDIEKLREFTINRLHLLAGPDMRENDQRCQYVHMTGPMGETRCVIDSYQLGRFCFYHGRQWNENPKGTS
jgi:hypothetical protein